MTATRTRRVISAVAAASLAAGGLALAVTPAAADAAPDLDFFADSVSGLRAGSVFESVTYERFESLLNSDGTFAFVLGGPGDARFEAGAAHIDAVAAQYGVDAIYTYNPVLDGNTVDSRTSTIPAVAALWTNLQDTYLNKDTTPSFTGTGTDPLLFVYDRAHTEGGVEDRIVATLAGAGDAASVDTDEEIAAFRAEIAGVFDAVSTGGVADLDTRSQFDFLAGNINARHKASYAEAELFGGDILTDADAADFRIQSITYPELLHLLESEGSHTILFGGTWCHNTRAVIHEVNRKAAQAGIDTVYLFDLRLDGWSNAPLHVRDTASGLAHLYGEVANTYLTNLRTQYVTNGSAGQRVEFRLGGDSTNPLEVAKKLQVPYLIQYDKDAAAPITKDWIQDNGDGTFREFMTEYWWIEDLPGKRSARYTTDEAWAAEQAKQWAFADAALAELDVFFGTGAPAPQPTETATPTPTETATPTPTQTATPTPTELPQTGGTAAVTVTGELRAGGEIVVRGKHITDGAGSTRVELHSTPVVLGTAATSADGSFELRATIPATVPAGSHSVVVFVDGVEVARTAVTVASGSSAAIPATGGDGALVGTAAALGVLVLAAGAGLLVAARRRAATQG